MYIIKIDISTLIFKRASNLQLTRDFQSFPKTISGITAYITNNSGHLKKFTITNYFRS